MIRTVYPADLNRKRKLQYDDQQKFENYIKTDDISVNEVVLLFTKEQITSMLAVVNNNKLNLPDVVTKRLNAKLNELLNARNANNTRFVNATSALKNLNNRLISEEAKIAEAALKAVFDDNDLHTFIKESENVPKEKQTSLLLRTLKLTDKEEENNKKVRKFIKIIKIVKSNMDAVSKKIRELLKNKYQATTDKANNTLINDLIQYYKETYCNVTQTTPLNADLREEYYATVSQEFAVGGGKKTLTKRRKLSKRLQTKKRRG